MKTHFISGCVSKGEQNALKLFTRELINEIKNIMPHPSVQ